MDKEEKLNDKTLGRVAEIVKTCPRFGDWDWCNTNCLLYDFCDGVYVAQRAQLPKPVGDTLKDAVSRILQPPMEPIINEAM